MPQEIERKFLVTGDGWRARIERRLDIRQGYLSLEAERAVRVRVLAGADKIEARLTVKGAMEGIARPEYEYPIPVEDAEELLAHLCIRPLIEKRRHIVPWGGLDWEIDEFFGENAGLIVAEVELDAADTEISLPAWVGADVTSDARYANAALVRQPYQQWRQK